MIFNQMPTTLKKRIILLIVLSLICMNKSYPQKLQWSTYFGGAGDEEGRALATDTAGNVYLTGWTTSTGISTDGTLFSGVYDAFLSKFNKDGNLVWATYFGGGDIENAFGIAIDRSGSIYICGSTASSDGIATKGAYQTKLGGFTDGFLAKFNSNGKRIWSTYYGGAENDQVSSIAIDSAANVYIVGFTLSATGIATAGAYNTQYGGGRDNGFLAKFDSSGSIMWATYYGGTRNDYSSAVTPDNIGNVYIAGYSSSPEGIATAGAFRTSVGGFYDAFLAKFTDKGQLLWGTYFGSNGDDEIGGICTDPLGNVYISGNTSSDSGLATNGAYQTSYSGGYDIFLAKFSGSGALKWCTYYGGTGNDFTWNMDISRNQEISITGYTNSRTGISTSGTYQVSEAGMNDAYVAQFDLDGNLTWSSYFGGSDNDNGYGVKDDQAGNVYIAGVTSSLSGIASSGAHSNTLSGSSDAYLAKFSSSASGINKEAKNTEALQLYPNPVSGFVTLAYSLIQASPVRIELFDINGKLISVPEYQMQSEGSHNYKLDTNKPGLKSGVYYLRLSANYGVSCVDFVKP